MNSMTVVSIIAAAMALVLVIRGLRSHQLPRKTMMTWAAVWVGIIIVVALIAGNLGLG